MKKTTAILAALLALALALPAVAEQGKGKKKKRNGGTAVTATVSSGGTSVSVSFGKSEIRLIRDWFANPQNLRGLPPGLAKREQLPPGLQRHLERNGTLPPGLQKKIQPLPVSLAGRLPRRPDGIDIVFVVGNVLLLEARTSKILDIVVDVVI